MENRVTFQYTTPIILKLSLLQIPTPSDRRHAYRPLFPRPSLIGRSEMGQGKTCDNVVFVMVIKPTVNLPWPISLLPINEGRGNKGL